MDEKDLEALYPESYGSEINLEEMLNIEQY